MRHSPFFRVQALALLLGCLAGTASDARAQSGSCASAPDLIFYNAHVVTLDPSMPAAEAIAVAGDSVMAVGPDPVIRALATPGCGTRLYDLQGRTVLPGFNDSHSHWLSWRQQRLSADERVARSSTRRTARVVTKPRLPR